MSNFTPSSLLLHIHLGFSRCQRGPDAGAYHHPYFLRGDQSLAKKIVRTKIKGCGHKTMKFTDSEPDFYSMAPLSAIADRERSDVSSASSISSARTVETQYSTLGQIVPSLPGRVSLSSNQSSPSPSILSGDSLPTLNNSAHVYPTSIMMADPQRVVSRRSSEVSGVSSSSSNFVNALNQSIFIHELASVCTTLCNLRKDTNL